MKFIKWKILIITAAVCLVPIFFGLFLWENLPETMAIHFDINNNPDNFASKAFVVFGLPVMMALLQLISCLINDINAKKHGDRIKFEIAVKWIIPVMCVVLQIITLAYGLGVMIDIRRVAMIIVALVLIVIGNYMPKLDYVKNADVDTQKARKINRFTGNLTVILGVLCFISAFLPTVFSIVCIILIMPCAIICTIYGIVVSKK